MEELENEISTQAEENTVSLASAQALADALAKIEVYTPTTWVDNSSPDIDAEHLNKPEQAIKRVTDALNSAVDVIKDLQSQVTKNSGAISDVNNNLGNINSRLDTSLSSSVLDYALTLPEGMHTVRFPGDGYTGADIPNSYYRYSCATIIVRSKGKIVTVLLYGISTKAPLAVNSYDGGKWNGWDQYVTKDDLATKLELVATDFLPLTAATIQPNNYTFFIFNPSLPSGYILVGACLKDTNALARKVVPVYCNASSSNGTHRINLQLANTSNDVVSITADMAIAFYLFVRKK